MVLAMFMIFGWSIAGCTLALLMSGALAGKAHERSVPPSREPAAVPPRDAP